MFLTCTHQIQLLDFIGVKIIVQIFGLSTIEGENIRTTKIMNEHMNLILNCKL